MLKSFSFATFSIVVLSLTSFAAQAGDFSNLQCWRGFNQKQQNENLSRCRQQAKQGPGDQKCSANWNENQQAVYDVCLMSPNGPLQVLNIFKGFNQAEQNKNLAECRRNESVDTVCVSNWLIHKQAVYDVSLMGVIHTSPKPAVAVMASANTAPAALPKPSVGTASLKVKNYLKVITADAYKTARYLSYSGSCYRVDVNGKTFGSSVEDSFCHYGFSSYHGSCYNVDARNQTYGNPVADSLCRFSAWSYKGSCYSADANGNLYGSTLDDIECHSGSYGVYQGSCYRLDIKGKIYGFTVQDSLCQRK